jgi:hypothetical protein
VAVSVTAELRGSLAEQVDGQLIPPPETEPFPATPTVSTFVELDETQAALIPLLADSPTVHDCAAPLHAPPQPLNESPPDGVSKTVSVEPVSAVQLHAVAGVVPSVPQSTTLPCGAFSGALTKPVPFDASYVTDSVLCVVPTPVDAKLASTTLLPSAPASIVQLPLTMTQSPPQPTNDQLFAAAWVSVTVPPLVNVR